MAVFDDLLALDWPAEFIVEYTDGRKEQLFRGDGVNLMLPADDPEGYGGLSANLPQKHPRNQKHCGRFIRFTELRTVYSSDGHRLWSSEQDL